MSAVARCRSRSLTPIIFATVAATALACAPVAEDGAEQAVDLPVGDRLDGDKADGNWGAALTCKPVPNLPRLAQPEIVVSLHGLTVRLFDRTTGFERVFPAGVGAIDTAQSSTTFGESKSAYPLIATGAQSFAILGSAIQPCKTWWTDPDTGAKSPVFAGLPFLPWYGGYALHGPIDDFRAPNGGSLRRGFVSHGCVRMQSADILEIYARIKGVARIPVRVQREPDRRADGSRYDVASAARFVGAECQKDSDCAFTGGLCKTNAIGGRGFCTARCNGGCADRAGAPTTFCVADPDASGSGMCVPKRMPGWPDCRALDHFVGATRARFGGTAATASVCVPGSPGWVGDRCRQNADCRTGLRCAQKTASGVGVCTVACAAACADDVSRPRTFCAREPSLAANGGTCLRACTPASNAPECPAGFDCVDRTRPSNGTHGSVCVPH